MIAAIMQPYFLPYLGYWQLLKHVDVFVVYDDIQFTKKGWINRNRFLLNGQPELFTIPLKGGSSLLDIKDRFLSDDCDRHLSRLSRRISETYRSAPFLDEGLLLVDRVLSCTHRNLFDFILNSIQVVCAYLGLSTRIVVSSTLNIPPGLTGQERVIATCMSVAANVYVNPIGGLSLYDSRAFARQGVRLQFQQAKLEPYKQAGEHFVPSLSIVDCIMWVGLQRLREQYLAMDVMEAAS